jgi:hypothetical protein
LLVLDAYRNLEFGSAAQWLVSGEGDRAIQAFNNFLAHNLTVLALICDQNSGILNFEIQI